MNKKWIYKNIVYVNFSPYENAGKMQDYLLNTFENVFLFSFNFHKLATNQKPGTLQIFNKGKLVKLHSLFQASFPSYLVFLLLPYSASVIFLQLFWWTKKLKHEYKKIDIYFTVNAYTAWIGNILRSLKYVEKTFFWVWDYYPPLHENKFVSLLLWIYWQFDKIGSKSDRLVFLNKRLQDLRKDIGILSREKNYPVISIGTDPVKKIIKRNPTTKKITLGFLGVIKKTQGLDFIFNNFKEILSALPYLNIKIIGAGPDMEYFKRRAKKTKLNVHFYGFVPNKSDVNKILSTCDIGIALYLPEKSNVSNYTDNSKIKDYLSIGLPVITTNIPSSEEVQKKKAGIVINYNNIQEFINATITIIKNYESYQKNSLKMARKYYYKKLYNELFQI